MLAAFIAPGAGAQSRVETGKAIFRGNLVSYQVVGGRAMLDGDIDLGPVDELEGATVAASKPLGQRDSATVTGRQYLWQLGRVPYVVDPDVPDPRRIADAIANWEQATPIRFTPRSNEPNFVRFLRYQYNGTCVSSLGMLGGRQDIWVDDACAALALTHELGHTVGLYHEQNRADRDYYLVVHFENIDKRRFSDSIIRVPFVTDAGPYDFGSIMHYTRFHSPRDRQGLAHETIPPGIPIEENGHGLSAGDIDQVARMYGQPPAKTTITTNPEGLVVIVDGVRVTGPRAFDWPAGSVHTVDVPDRQGDGTNTRYLFGRWSDNNPRAHTITASPDLTVYAIHFVRQYLLTTNVAPAGSGAVTAAPASADGYYTDGTAVTLTATPAAGYAFFNWRGTGAYTYTTLDGWSSPVNSFHVADPGLTYSAVFTKSPFVTITTDPPNIPITVNGGRGSGPRNFGVNPGATLAVSAEAEISFGWNTVRYVFLGWSDGGAPAHTVTVPASGTMPAVTARYKMQHAVTAAVSGRGSVTVTPASPDGFYDHGATIQIAAVPDAGYQLANWSGDLSGAALSNSMVVNEQVYVQANFLQPFTVSAANIVNAANFLYTPVSPGEIVTLFGLQIGPADLRLAALDDAGRFASTLGGARVLFDGVAAPLVYAAQNQIAAIVPYEVDGKTSTGVQVELNGRRTPTTTVAVAPAAPAIFTADGSGRSQAAIFNQDGSLNSSPMPAVKGSVMVLFATGEGQTSPPGANGKVASAAPFPVPKGKVTVRFGGPAGLGKEGRVLYAGAAPGLVAGALQINVQIPDDAPTGNVPVVFCVDGNCGYEMTAVAIK
jgi:uncharacterized protein (TIGR03437 family)